MAERSLGIVLHCLQTGSGLQDANGGYGAISLFPRVTGLLTILSNPLNVTLLSSTLLSSPAIWDAPGHNLDLHTCRRILSVFHSAAIHIVQREEKDEGERQHAEKNPTTAVQYQQQQQKSRPRTLAREDWLTAVLAGATDKAPRWRHLTLLAGLLIGFEGQHRQSLTFRSRRHLEDALLRTVHLALADLRASPPIAAYCVVMALTYTWDLLSRTAREGMVDCDALLPVLVDAAFVSAEGLGAGTFLSTALDRDVVKDLRGHLEWSPASPSFRAVKAVQGRPLVASLGPLSKIVAFAVERGVDRGAVLRAVDTMVGVSGSMLAAWRGVKISGVDRLEEGELIVAETMQTTLPVLRQVLKVALFSMVIALRAVLGRVINDSVLANDTNAPTLAINALTIQRNLSFVSALTGPTSPSTFVNLTAIDILSQYPDLSRHFLTTIRPTQPGLIPAHPLDRCLDLFFLNTAEHFSLVLPPSINERLLIAAALPYLSSGADSRLLEIFEAAHSVVLSVLAAPASAEMAVRYLELYVNNLFSVFPANLSARQFRLAYKTILQITAPPSPLANTQPFLPSTLLDMLYTKALHAPTTPLPPHVTSPPDPSGGGIVESAATSGPQLSEQAVLTLALIDCLCYLDVGHLEEWLPLTGGLIKKVRGGEMREACRERFWECLSGGEMDVNRAHFCVVWWSTRGGREWVLGEGREDGEGEGEGEHLMSGAAPVEGEEGEKEKDGREEELLQSKL